MNARPARARGQTPRERAGRLHWGLREMAHGGLLIAAYLGLEWLSDIHEYKGLPVTAWNPSLGMIFAVMLTRPLVGGLLLCIGMVLAEILVVHSVLDVGMISLLGLLSAASYALAAYALAACITRATAFRLDRGLARLRDIIVLLLAGGLGALVNALLLSLVLIVTGSMTWFDLGEATVPLFVGDVIGIAVITPLCLRLVSLERGAWTVFSLYPRACFMVAGVGLLMGGFLWVILDPANPNALTHLYVLVLPLIGLALWQGFDGACAGLALGQALLVLILHAHGYGQEAFITAQSVMVVLGATALLCGAAVSERDAAHLAARTAQTKLAAREAAALRADRFHLATGMTSALSHEITQPITAARSLARAAQLRMDTQLSPDLPRLRENLGEIVKQIDLAAAILSRMRAFIGRGTPERQTVIIGDVLIDTLSLIGPRAAAHHITITSNITPNLPQAACDPIQIQQVLMNLIGNAIDAIVAGGVTGGVTGGVGTTTDAGAWTNTADRQRSGAHIMLDVTEARGSAPDTGRITICVRDNGPGVPADLAPHVFDALTTDKAGGLGLGLSICALIVEAHGGRIWLENPGPGGTEFRFWLPTMPGAADAG